MAKVMTKCPETAHAIATGVEVESDADFDALADIAYHADCPLCGDNHEWFKCGAWIEQAPELQRPRAKRQEAGLAC